MSPDLPKRIDMHCHVGLVGDAYPLWGRLSEWYRTQITYRTFLLYAGIPEDQVCDRTLRAATERTIDDCGLNHVVCLALDPVYDEAGVRREDRSHVWVHNDYVLDLRRSLGTKVLLGASVHPFDQNFQDRVRHYVDCGAVLLKWLPSAQQFPLWHPKVRGALEFLATAGPAGNPFPLLLHVGPEYAIPSSDLRTQSYDFLSWSFWDRARNLLRGSSARWHTPLVSEIHETLRFALASGATIIFAHCGLPYFAPLGLLGKRLEHSDLNTITRYLNAHHPGATSTGRCYADVSACATPFRESYFKKLMELPEEALLLGSDFPTPVFELSADLKENLKDLGAVLKGHVERILVPQDNLLDVNLRELQHAFPGHAMFENFGTLLSEHGLAAVPGADSPN